MDHDGCVLAGHRGEQREADQAIAGEFGVWQHSGRSSEPLAGGARVKWHVMEWSTDADRLHTSYKGIAAVPIRQHQIISVTIEAAVGGRRWEVHGGVEAASSR
jgi:hypothetical protein